MGGPTVRTISYIALALVLILLISLLWSILIRGLPLLDWEMLTKIPSGGFYLGGEGGIANAIIGSLYLAGGATVLGFFLAFLAVLWMHGGTNRDSRARRSFRLLATCMSGVPTVIYGAFAFLVMQAAGVRACLGAGILAVGFFVTPIIVRALDEAFLAVPNGLMESVLGLGSNKTRGLLTVAARQSVGGIVTALILGFTRALGNSATVLFAAGFTDSIPDSLSRPAASLPLAVYFQLSSPIEGVRERAFAAAAVLTVLILILSLTARFLERRLGRYMIR